MSGCGNPVGLAWMCKLARTCKLANQTRRSVLEMGMASGSRFSCEDWLFAAPIADEAKRLQRAMRRLHLRERWREAVAVGGSPSWWRTRRVERTAPGDVPHAERTAMAVGWALLLVQPTGTISVGDTNSGPLHFPIGT